MALLIAGVAFWTLAHLFPAVAPGVRANLAGKLGEGPYKGLFAVDIVIALGLIIFGWKTAIPTSLYAPPVINDTIPLAFIILAFVLFVASSLPNNLKRYIRHPQMGAVICWGIGHLLTNGDSRSVVLFGGLTVWAVLEVMFINKRDGEWARPTTVPLVKDIITAVVAGVVFAAVAYFHTALFGVPAIST